MQSLRKQNKPQRNSIRPLRIIGNIALIVSLLLCVWVMSAAVAYGWILHADHYGAAFAAYGKWMFGLSAAMTLAVILYFCRLDLPAAVLGTVSYIPMLVILLRAISAAEKYSWSGQTEASFGKNAAEVWRNGQMWNALPLLLLLALSLTRWLSYDARVRRKARRDAKIAAENAAAPSILDDSVC